MMNDEGAASGIVDLAMKLRMHEHLALTADTARRDFGTWPVAVSPEQDGPAGHDRSADAGDVSLLRSLAAVHAMYGDASGAIRFLALAEWIMPGDGATIALRAAIEVRRGRLDAAGLAIGELRARHQPVPEALEAVERRLRRRDGS